MKLGYEVAKEANPTAQKITYFHQEHVSWSTRSCLQTAHVADQTSLSTASFTHDNNRDSTSVREQQHQQQPKVWERKHQSRGEKKSTYGKALCTFVRCFCGLLNFDADKLT